MEELLKRIDDCLAVRGLSVRTCDAYLRYIKEFVAFSRQDVRELGSKDAERYLLNALVQKH